MRPSAAPPPFSCDYDGKIDSIFPADPHHLVALLIAVFCFVDLLREGVQG